MSVIKQSFLRHFCRKLRLIKKQAMYKLFIFLFLTCIFGSLIVNSQNIENWISSNEKIPAEKIYIQTDAENYFTGDTVWFKVYLIDSRSGQLIPRAENVYVNVIDESGESVIKLVLLCFNGQASGRFTVSENTKSGIFLMQAHTNYLFNFSPDSYFYKQLNISKISGSSRSISKADHAGNMVTDMVFLPEGGVLLENATNLVAFKATDKFGYGVNVRGAVKDERGVNVASFTSDYLGMGLFFLTPETGKSYSATVDGFPSFRYKFVPVKEGIKIQLVNHTSTEVIVNIAGNSENLSEESFYLVNMYRGEVLFYQTFKMDGINKVFKFESSSLKPGINKLVLLDNQLNLLSERYLFSRNFELNNLFVQTDSKVFNKRSEIKLQITDEKYLSDEDFSNLSVSVVHEKVIPENGFSKNILSQLYIDSELNGFVESSAELFEENKISVEAKLRLLMLTCRNEDYFWNEAPNKSEKLQFKQESGINLTGVANNSLTNNVISNGEITMAIQKDDEVAFLTQKTDSLGNFSFPGLLFNDTASIHVQAKNEAGKMNIDVVVDPVFKSAIPSEYQFKLLKDNTTAPSQLAELKYKIYTENKKNQPKVKITKSKKTNKNNGDDDGHFRLYESADYVLEVAPFEQSYNNILDFMVGKVPGVDINGNEIRIRGASSFVNNAAPLFLLDGVPLVGSQEFNLPNEVTRSTNESGIEISNSNEQLLQVIRSIPISDVDKIEVLKSSQNTAVYGVKGANGVIAIYTRRGGAFQGSTIGKGIISNKVTGYSKYKEFHLPVYTPENVKDKKTDLRTLLYWNPEVTTKNGIAELHFFSSDQAGKYKVIVEGIANDGKVCIGSTEFEIF